MPFVSLQTILAFLLGVVASALYLRIVAKEKCRRKRHLELRMTEKLKELDEKQDKKAPGANRGFWTSQYRSGRTLREVIH